MSKVYMTNYSLCQNTIEFLNQISFPEKDIYRSSIYLGRDISTSYAGEKVVHHIIEDTKLTSAFKINHDKNGAPYVKIGGMHNNEHILLSLTDEQNYTAGAAIWIKPYSTICGIGIDLASIDDFIDTPKNQIFFKKMFTEEELQYVSGFPKEEAPYKMACIFSAKEASLKSIAAKIRIMDPKNLMKLPGKFVDFAIHFSDGKIEATPQGKTLETVKLLGINRIKITQKLIEDMAFSIALAFSDRKDSI